MVKLNELADNEGARKGRMRVGRGPGSGKGKTSGRGVKGQTSRTGHGMNAFEGGQMPLHMRMPKRGFNNPDALKFAEVNIWRLVKAIEADKIDAAKPIDAGVLKSAGLIRRELDGVKLLGLGDLSVKLHITCYAATAKAVQIVEAAGGTVVQTKTPVAAEG
jgi:large subunit ribosomal protein L15